MRVMHAAQSNAVQSVTWSGGSDISRSASLLLLVLVAGVLAPGAIAQSQASEKEAVDPLSPLAPFIGHQWTGEVKMLDGNSSPAQAEFKWGVNQKLVRIKFYMGPEEQRVLINEGFAAWHAGEERVYYSNVSIAGTLSIGVVESDGNTLTIPYTEFIGEGTVRARMVFRLVDLNHYTWQVFQDKDGELTPLTGESHFSRP